MFNALELQFGIDLGTSNTIIYQHGKGIVLQEPSVIAVRHATGEIQAFGAEAQAMIGRAPGSLEIIYPLQEGVISNFDWSTAMLQHFMKKFKPAHGFANRRYLSLFLAALPVFKNEPWKKRSFKKVPAEPSLLKNRLQLH
ncbi:rod shape-determining protein [Paenibacillus sp. RC67]|uniref:rod shape-determining protein n=1 Tax=Paenibacillus sp. RC67 TaxID=3039392 RepID=UPI0032C22C08